MKNTLVLLAFAAFYPIVAGAQVAPPIRGLQPAVSSANTHGITVNGTSVLRVPASSARITLQITSADNKTVLTQAELGPLVDALVKAGAERSSVQLPLAFAAGGYSNSATVSAIVERPTVDMMRGGIATVGAAVAGMKDVRLNSAQVQLNNDDCSQTLVKVRASAIASARTKAASIAKQLGVTLGGVVNVNAFDPGSADGSCASQYWVGPMGAQFGPGAENTDSDYVSVPVTSNVTITYAIK
jgi:Protein of unknown function (DUF541)